MKGECIILEYDKDDPALSVLEALADNLGVSPSEAMRIAVQNFLALSAITCV